VRPLQVGGSGSKTVGDKAVAWGEGVGGKWVDSPSFLPPADPLHR